MIAHKRIRVKTAGKVEEGPLQYNGGYSKAQGWTDIRVIDIPAEAILRTELMMAKGKTVPEILNELIAKQGGHWIAFNASFFNPASGNLVGQAYLNGKVVAKDVPGKTEHRPHLYRQDGRFGIGRLPGPDGVDWAVVGVPTLTAAGQAIAPPRWEEKTPNDVLAINPRMIVGIKSDGSFGLIVVDGRGNTDRGVTIQEAGHAALHFGYADSVNLDGGGSATIATNNRQLLDALDIDKIAKKRNYHVCDLSRKHAAAPIHHAVAIQIDPEKLFPNREALFGIDCATPLTAKTAKALADEGVHFAVRYLVPSAYAWKRLTRVEANAITEAGMLLATVFQLGKNRPQGGADNGKEDGRSAKSEAKEIGQPLGSAIFMAVDYDAQPDDYDAIEQYLHAVQAELNGYRVGIYGHYAVIEEMARRGACKFFWQTSSWSRNKQSARANLFQYKHDVKLAGVTVDFNRAYTTDMFWGR